MSKTTLRYHYINDEYGIESLRHRRLKIAFPDQVNDLYEFMPFDFGSGSVEQKLKKIWPDRIKKYSMGQGFVSFSEHWNIPTMWAHYAERNKGLCLGFEVKTEVDAGPTCVKVEYKKDLLLLDRKVTSDEEYNRRMVSYASRTKSIHWQYEAEWRFWCSLSAIEQAQKRAQPNRLFFKDYDHDTVLKEIIVGPASNRSGSELRSLLRPSDEVAVTKASRSDHRFEMIRAPA